ASTSCSSLTCGSAVIVARPDARFTVASTPASLFNLRSTLDEHAAHVMPVTESSTWRTAAPGAGGDFTDTCENLSNRGPANAPACTGRSGSRCRRAGSSQRTTANRVSVSTLGNLDL